MPTDTGPLRTPIAEAVPAVAQLQQQVPVARERLQGVLGLGTPAADEEQPPSAGDAGHDPRPEPLR